MNNSLHHLAFIVDGNRRWARTNGLSISEGHRRGYATSLWVAEYCARFGVPIITLWLFSTENWQRDNAEVNDLMRHLEWIIAEYFKQAMQTNQRLVHLGRTDRLPRAIVDQIAAAEAATKQNTQSIVCLAIDYGGQDEIARTAQKVLTSGEALTEETLLHYSDTGQLPYPKPDLIVRTSGEQRLSGFMLLQAGTSQLLFEKKFFPDLEQTDIDRFLRMYQRASVDEL